MSHQIGNSAEIHYRASDALRSTYVSSWKSSEQMLKYGIWAYFILLIFEGALRKWVAPGLATPLLVVRDPIGIYLILKAWEQRRLPANLIMGSIIFIGIFELYTAIFMGHGNLPVAIYGARILLIHFPLMFVIGSIMDQEDVIKIGKVMIWLAVPMVILIGFQFYSPQSAWINRGVGGNMEGSGFQGALGYFRPSGTFSFTSGNALFFNLLTPFVLYFWLVPNKINIFILIGATIALLAAIPLSISRGLFFSIGVSVIFALAVVLRNPRYIGKLLVIGAAGLTIILILGNYEFFQTATFAFTARFETANKTEGGVEGVLLGRYLGGLIEAVTGGASGNTPFFGHGLGMGTNVGSMLLTGEAKFLIAEGEWGRVIGEMGFLFGFAVILIRLGFCFKLATASYMMIAKKNILPWLLLSFALLVIPQGQWAQPTILGFSTLAGGLVIASLKPRLGVKNEDVLDLGTL